MDESKRTASLQALNPSSQEMAPANSLNPTSNPLPAQKQDHSLPYIPYLYKAQPKPSLTAPILHNKSSHPIPIRPQTISRSQQGTLHPS